MSWSWKNIKFPTFPRSLPVWQILIVLALFVLVVAIVLYQVREPVISLPQVHCHNPFGARRFQYGSMSGKRPDPNYFQKLPNTGICEKSDCKIVAMRMCDDEPNCAYASVEKDLDMSGSVSTDRPNILCRPGGCYRVHLFSDSHEKRDLVNDINEGFPRYRSRLFRKNTGGVVYAKEVFKTDWDKRFEPTNIKKFEQVKSQRACESHCRDTKQCDAYSYNKKTERCDLHAACFPENAVASVDTTSVLLTSASKKEARLDMQHRYKKYDKKVCTLATTEEVTDPKDRPNVSEDGCRRTCDRTTDCSAYSYTTKGNKKMCRLFRSCATMEDAPNTNTWSKREPISASRFFQYSFSNYTAKDPSNTKKLECADRRQCLEKLLNDCAQNPGCDIMSHDGATNFATYDIRNNVDAELAKHERNKVYERLAPIYKMQRETRGWIAEKDQIPMGYAKCNKDEDTCLKEAIDKCRGMVDCTGFSFNNFGKLSKNRHEYALSKASEPKFTDIKAQTRYYSLHSYSPATFPGRL